MKNYVILVLAACAASMMWASFDAQSQSPIQALLVTGGDYHDYRTQQEILLNGLAQRIEIEFDVIHDDPDGIRHTLSQAGWHDSYDVVVYNFCDPEQNDGAFVRSLARIHESGKAAVALHCAIHSYHFRMSEDGDVWPRMLGVKSPGHGEHAPITVRNLAPNHPVMKDMPSEWVTPRGELYHAEALLPTATPLAKATIDGGETYHYCIWTNEYGEARIFGTTLGHHNETMQTDAYLNLVSNGILWATEIIK